MKFTILASAIAFVSSASALISNCAQVITAQEGDSCRSVAVEYKASVQQIYRWNFVGSDYAAGDCAAFVPGEKYCVKVDSALRKRHWFYKTKGLTGAKLALAKKKISSANAAKKTTTKKTTTKKTTTKKTTTAVKVPYQSKPGDDWSSTPSNAPANAVRHIISNCTKFATVIAADLWCGPFADKYGITEAQLYDWNAGLHKNCDNLDDGKAYCIAA